MRSAAAIYKYTITEIPLKKASFHVRFPKESVLQYTNEANKKSNETDRPSIQPPPISVATYSSSFLPYRLLVSHRNRPTSPKPANLKKD